MLKSPNSINTIEHISLIPVIPVRIPVRIHSKSFSNIKDVSKKNKPYKDESHCKYTEYLHYDQNEALKVNDYIWKDDNIYFILSIDNNTKFKLVNLETNEIITEEFPFYYCKIDGNDPTVLFNTYLNIRNQ